MESILLPDNFEIYILLIYIINEKKYELKIINWNDKFYGYQKLINQKQIKKEYIIPSNDLLKETKKIFLIIENDDIKGRICLIIIPDNSNYQSFSIQKCDNKFFPVNYWRCLYKNKDNHEVSNLNFYDICMVTNNNCIINHYFNNFILNNI